MWHYDSGIMNFRNSHEYLIVTDLSGKESNIFINIFNIILCMLVTPLSTINQHKIDKSQAVFFKQCPLW